MNKIEKSFKVVKFSNILALEKMIMDCEKEKIKPLKINKELCYISFKEKDFKKIKELIFLK